jgi:hypothetical protein
MSDSKEFVADSGQTLKEGRRKLGSDTGDIGVPRARSKKCVRPSVPQQRWSAPGWTASSVCRIA